MDYNARIEPDELRRRDVVLNIGRNYIPDGEILLRNTIFAVFAAPDESEIDSYHYDLLAESVFWSLGELINNANKANNRWALLRDALFRKAIAEKPDSVKEQLTRDIDYAIEHSQNDLLTKYNLHNLDLTSSLLRLIEVHKTNSFAISEKFGKKIDMTLRLRQKGEREVLVVNVINNSPITVVDRDRVEYNLNKIKEDLINAGKNPFEAAVRLYDKASDYGGGGFGAGLRSIVLFLKEGYKSFSQEIVYSRLIQYRSASSSTIFTIELPLPPAVERAGG